MTGPVWHEQALTRQQRWSLHNLRGITVWLTGLSGSGKSTIANEAARILFASGVSTYVLDADNVRHGLNADLGFTDADRTENIRRMAEASRLITDAGLVTFVPIISPFASSRDFARKIHAADGLDFIEVFVATELAECEKRDPKGLYAKARNGEMTGMTGVDSPYEAPQHADIVLGRFDESVSHCANALANAINLRRNLKN
jgi:adenylyl-sulfate kinase